MFDKYIVLISAVTGLVGTAAGATISYLSLRHTFKRDKFKIRIKLQQSLLAWPQPGTTKPKIQEDMLTYNIANIGYKEFTVVSLGLELGKRTGGLFINDPIGTVKTPYVLKPDETCAFWGEYKSIKGKIAKPKFHNKLKIRAYTSDYLGNVFRSNWITVSFKESKLDKIKVYLKTLANNAIKLIQP